MRRYFFAYIYGPDESTTDVIKFAGLGEAVTDARLALSDEARLQTVEIFTFARDGSMTLRRKVSRDQVEKVEVPGY